MIEVAITGIGVVSALGNGAETFWRELLAGRSGLRPGGRLAVDGVPRRGEVQELEVRGVVETPIGRRIDRTSLLALTACRLALADANDAFQGCDPARLGLTLGSGLGNLGETAPFLDRLFSRGAGNPLVFPNMVMNAPLSYASIELGVTGPTALLTEQEASGEAAIAWGAELVAEGAVDVCLAGATDELDIVRQEVLRDAGILAAGEPHALDAGADGVVPGEGAAVLVLEPLTRARARGVRIYARLRPHPGFGVPAPLHGWPREPAHVARRLGPLVADADLVVAAASGAPGLDVLETAALATALGGRRAAVTAPRGALGDFGAAGALAVAAAALAVYTGRVPPTLAPTGPPPAGLDVVRGAARETSVEVAVVDGLARGGACRPLRLEGVRR